MRKVIVKYDGNQIFDLNDSLIVSWIGLECEDYQEEQTYSKVQDILELRKGGFTAEEIKDLLKG